MSLFSKENKAAFTNPLNLDNPILVHLLGPRRDIAAQACHRDGSCRDGDYSIC